MQGFNEIADVTLKLLRSLRSWGAGVQQFPMGRRVTFTVTKSQ